MRIVEITQSWEWRCPDCWNYTQSFGVIPREVTCSHCGRLYSTGPEYADYARDNGQQLAQKYTFHSTGAVDE